MCLVEVYLKEFALVKFLGYFDLIAGKQDSRSLLLILFLLYLNSILALLFLQRNLFSFCPFYFPSIKHK